MQTANIDLADKAAALKAQSIAVDTEYVQANRAHWLTLNGLHYAFGSLAGAANKLENAPQDDPATGLLVATVIEQIAAAEALLSTIDIDKVRTDAAYAGSQLKRVQAVRASAEAVDQLAAAIAKTLQASTALTTRTQQLETFVTESATKKRVAVVKGDFTHSKGGSPVQFHKGWHCDIDHELENGDMSIGAGSWGVFFKAEEISRFFDIVEV